jgi:AraC-like DNA-binding protein
MGTVSVVLVRPLVAALPSTALDSFWQASDLTPPIVADDDARISAAQFCVAWSEAIRLTGDRQLALRIGTSLPAGAFGIIEYVCRSAPTVGVALRQWVRYLNLLDDAVTVVLEVDGDRAYLRVSRESEAPAPASHEMCWAVVARFARELSRTPLRWTTVEFTHQAHSDVAAYRAWFDAPVVFGAESTQLVMPAAMLDATLVSADPKLLAILTRAADDLARQVTSDAPLTAQVKRSLQDAMRSAHGDIEHVAKRLGLPPRSMQRRLKDEGTSFQAVREELRHTLARRYLADGLAIAEISFLLGFSEPSAFFRAFKRWTGETPLAHRQRLTTSA